MAKASPVVTKEVLQASLEVCIANGERILDDAVQVEFQEPPCTKLMLSMIAQEEFAKAFLLFMVSREIIPWSPYLLRAMNDHACKQLVGVVMEYVDPEWETLEELRAIIRNDSALNGKLPGDVGSALNILRHEKIGRWESNNWVWDGEPKYDAAVLRIAEGKRDRIKQDALYVRLGRDGRVASRPTDVAAVSADAEYERALQYQRLVKSLAEQGDPSSQAYEKVREAFSILFGPRR